jgi:hypothetical protein
MHVQVEAKTAKGLRRFMVPGNSGAEAGALLRALIERRERVIDETGELFEAFQIDANSIEAKSVLGERRLGSSRFGTDGRLVR